MDLPSGGQARARDRLTEAVKRSRTGVPVSDLARQLQAMSIDEAVQEIERRLRRAFSRQTSALEALRAVDDAAQALEVVGLPEDGARLRLVAAAALEGRELGPTMQDMRLVATMIASAAAEEVDSARSGAEPLGDFMSWAFDAEGDAYSDTIAIGKAHELVDLGKSWREALVREGRVVAVGHCRRCRVAVRLDADQHCPDCGRRIKHVDFVVPSEVEAALRGFER